MKFSFCWQNKNFISCEYVLFCVRQACNLMLVLEQLILLALGVFYITSLIMISQIFPTLMITYYFQNCNPILGLIHKWLGQFNLPRLLEYGNTGCRVFKWGYTKLESNYWIFIIGVIGRCQKSVKIWLSKLIFYVKNHWNLSQFFFHRRITI